MSKPFTKVLVLCLGLGPVCFEVQARPLLAHTRLTQGHWQVWLAEPDGKNARAFTSTSWDKRSLRAVPGKPELLLRDNEGRLYSLDLTRPAAERKVELGFEVIKDFDFHPQSGWLVSAYSPNAMDNVCIWHLSLDHSAKHLVVPDPYLNETPRWLSDGKAFLFAKAHASRSQLCRAELAQTKTESFVQGNFITATDPAISPDGRTVVFCGRTGKNVDLWLCSERGQDVRHLYGNLGLEAEPSWSANGDWVYFVTWDGGDFRLARIRPSGSDFGMVSPAGTDCRCPLLVADGGVHE